jgi:predicted Fe-Mo cluster-binding NifX family protein
MNVCIPTNQNLDLESQPYGHFGSAHFFVLHDTESGATSHITNNDQNHIHGACQPTDVLIKRKVGAVIVGGIGKRAIMLLNSMGIRVYRSGNGSIRENVRMLEGGELEELTPETGCTQHGHGCDH